MTGKLPLHAEYMDYWINGIEKPEPPNLPSHGFRSDSRACVNGICTSRIMHASAYITADFSFYPLTTFMLYSPTLTLA